MSGICQVCGASHATVQLGDELLCDRCVDERIAEVAGLPTLPEAPADEILTGGDGTAHAFRFRLWRAPTGVVAEAGEVGLHSGEGYRFKAIGPHDVDIEKLLATLRRRVRAGLSQVQLKSNPTGEGWIAAGTELTGRLEWNGQEAGKPYDAIVDGKRLTWDELGRALEPFEGWDFTLTIEGMPVLDAGGAAAAKDAPASSVDGDFDDLDMFEDLDMEDEAFLEAWSRAEAQAVDLLRGALAELRDEPPPPELGSAVDRLLEGMSKRAWPYEHMRRAAGLGQRDLEQSPDTWLAALGGMVAMREESGLEPEEESMIMALEHADWLGAVIGLARAGVGAPADPATLVRYVNECPEVDGEVDPEEAFAVETAFELVLPAWEVGQVVDSSRRLTKLGQWGLPRALAWAWDGEFDGPLQQ
ncbi:MAG: hypothetical protein WD602_06470 [Actinomycetota bacterium]